MRLTSPVQATGTTASPGLTSSITTTKPTTKSISTSLLSLISAFLPIPLAVLGVAYLWTLSQRPGIPERFQVEDPHEYGFPKWYGPTRSAHDHSPLIDNDGEKCEDPKRVLLFVDLSYDSPYIPHALETIKSLHSDPSVNLTLISPLSESIANSNSPMHGWNQTFSAQQNLERADCNTVDFVWRISDRAETDLLGACMRAIWISELLGEGRQDGRSNITLLNQPHDLLRPENSHNPDHQSPRMDLGLLAYVSPSADPAVYYPSKNIESRTSVTYFPLRETPRREYPRLPWGRGWTIYSPSSGTVPNPKFGEDPFAPGSKWRKYWDKEEARLGHAMRQAGICLFEGWHEGVLDERMVKAMLSGCVVASVTPQSEYASLKPFLLALPRPASHSQSGSVPIPTELSHIVSHMSQSEMKRKVLQEFIHARKRFSPSARNQRIWEVVDLYKGGGRGYDFPKGFRWDCDSAVRPPWCEGG